MTHVGSKEIDEMNQEQRRDATAQGPAGPRWISLELRSIQADSKEHSKAPNQDETGKGGVIWREYATFVAFPMSSVFVRR